MTRTRLTLIYAASFVAHGALAAAVSAIEPPRVVETVRITMRDVPPEVPEPPPPPEPEPETPPPPPPPPEAPLTPRAPRPEPPPEAAPPPPAAAAPLDFGVAMQGGVGLGGVAMPVGDVRASQERTTEPVTRRESRTLEEPPPPRAARAEETACSEEASRPRPLSMPQPAYTDAARAASVEGRVRVRITVDATGAVTGVEVLEGLGHGLDESAADAVRGARFEPSQRCGAAVEATFTISVRFTL